MTFARYRFDMLAASEAGRTEHPQLVIQAFFPDAHDFEPVPVADCWLFTAERRDIKPAFFEELPGGTE
jgi:hypothetical protein